MPWILFIYHGYQTRSKELTKTAFKEHASPKINVRMHHDPVRRMYDQSNPCPGSKHIKATWQQSMDDRDTKPTVLPPVRRLHLPSSFRH